MSKFISCLAAISDRVDVGVFKLNIRYYLTQPLKTRCHYISRNGIAIKDFNLPPLKLGLQICTRKLILSDTLFEMAYGKKKTKVQSMNSVVAACQSQTTGKL